MTSSPSLALQWSARTVDRWLVLWYGVIYGGCGVLLWLVVGLVVGDKPRQHTRTDLSLSVPSSAMPMARPGAAAKHTSPTHASGAHTYTHKGRADAGLYRRVR